MIISGYAFITTFTFKQFKNVPVGPEFFPRYLSVFLFLLCLILLIKALLTKKENDTPAPAINFFAKSEEGKGLRRMAACALVLLLLIFLWSYLGFLIATPIAVFVLQYILGNRKWVPMVIYSIVAPVVIFLIFKFVLGIEMPLGFMEALFY